MLADQAGTFEQMTEIEEVWQAVKRALTPEGVDFFIYLSVDPDFSHPHLLTNIPALYAGFPPQADPFLHHCCNSYAVTKTGVAYLPEHDYLPDEAKTFIQRARDSGFKTGLGLPMRLQGAARFGGFNLGTAMDREAFEARILPRREEFRLYCLLAHRRIEELTQQLALGSGEFPRPMIAPEHDEIAQLTPREREIAYLVAQGFSRKECARLCAISQHTVSDYLKSVYAKLGINDRIRLTQIFNAAGSDPIAPPD
ncbi:helix-turn-helix transcriptional regulator [Pseudooceanicola nitratireducens]